MINTLSTYIAFVALFIAVAVFLFSMTSTVDSSVQHGGEYNATQITSADVGTSSIKSLSGTIGSIIVSSTSPVTTSGPVIAFYETSSTTVATTSLTAKYTFGSLGGVTPPAGTYTFDVAFGSGIMIWVDPSFNGSYTMTYR